MSRRTHPYIAKPEYQFWKSASGARDFTALDPVTAPSFKIMADDRVVTAGSCFAQHVARHLVKSGFNHHVTETGHPLIRKADRESFNYGAFSARYGNLYTARQLLQLLQRAYGLFTPAEHAWPLPGGGVVDPFRPQIQPKGFIHVEELEADRTQHLAAVRRAVEELDVFVFTLGLTESWVDRRDGAVFPLAPGVAGGSFDEAIHAFHNFDASETTADLSAAFTMIRERNPTARFIVTVSPVPLNATALPRHVWVSTAYSKAVLRVAAEQVCSSWNNVDYFPSYEIITSPHVRGRYFAADGRDVLEVGVEHVMRVFLKHYGSVAENVPEPVPAAPHEDTHLEEMERIVRVLCDEEAISSSEVSLGEGAEIAAARHDAGPFAEADATAPTIVASPAPAPRLKLTTIEPMESAGTLPRQGEGTQVVQNAATSSVSTSQAWDVIRGASAPEIRPPVPEEKPRGFFRRLLGRG